MRSRVVVQARTTSSRLPGKAMLTVAGLPAAVLCARRAANTGLPVVLATSSDPTDDALAEAAAAAGIRVSRGPLHDVLARFAHAVDDLPDDAVVVRLTADNLFPDGAFVEDALRSFVVSDADYGTTMGPGDRLPYGVVCEVVRAAALRRAHAEATARADREHVLPWVRRTLRAATLSVGAPEDWADLRASVDTFDDWLRVVRVFAGTDPVTVPWAELCRRLRALAPEGRLPRTLPFSRLSLGTAQLGLPYGVANASGRPDEAAAAEILDRAHAAGVTLLDTAAAYGDAEARIGAWLESRRPAEVAVVTKLLPLADLPDDAPEATVRAHVEASVLRSCVRLGRPRLDGLLLHRWRHARSHGGAVWRALQGLRDEGRIGRLGASVASPAEALEALATPEVAFVQLPLNLLDRRWRSAGVPERRGERPDVVVQARSVYLQGLLVGAPTRWPSVQGYDVRGLPARLDALARSLGRAGRADLACAYVRAQGWVDTLVVGAETPAQVDANVALFRAPPLDPDACRAVEEALPDAPARLLDPSQWWT